MQFRRLEARGWASVRCLLPVLTAAQLAACGVFSNQQSSTDPPVLPPTTDVGLAIELKDFDVYVGKRVDARLVGGDDVILADIRLDPLQINNYRLDLGAVPQKPDSFVDLIVDANGNGQYDGPLTDRVWRREVNAQHSVQFSGNDPYQDVPEPAHPGGDFKLDLHGFGALDGRLLRLALVNPAGQITGLFTGSVTGDEFSIELPQVVVPTQPYRVLFFADANGNDSYDTPPADAAWALNATGDDNGIQLDFTYNEDFADIDFEQ